jgi:ABC-type transport system involved in multi-copper enzyme maturation permease subunit
MRALASWPVARAAAAEAALFPATLVIAAVLILLTFARGGALNPGGFSSLSGLSGFWLFLLVLRLGGRALSGEMESGHAQLVLLRPITRAQWVGGRLAGAAMVFCAVGTAAWASAFVLALLRGDAAPLGLRFALLPLALLPHLGWLATLVALSAVFGGWTSAVVLIAVRFGWVLLRAAAPALLPRWDLAPWLAAADAFFGPQDTVGEAGVRWSAVTWDVLWGLLAWLAAVLLFNRRELARRRP